MPIEHHGLLGEFPEFRGRIHELETGNPRFATLGREYQEDDEEIFRIAEGIETPSDPYTGDLKMKHVLIKEPLHALLRNA